MINLVLKDVAIQKKMLIFAFFYTVLESVCFNSMAPNGLALYVIAPIITNYLFISNAVTYDEKNKSEIVLNSLPLKRVDIVIAKYISIFVFIIIGIIYSILLGFIEKSIGLSIFYSSISLLDIVLVLTSACIFGSIFFPLYFKFGEAKMKIYNMIIFILFLFLPIYIANYATEYPKNILVQKFTFFLINTSSLIQNCLALIIGLIIFLFSLMLSIHIYKNKEF